jgi:hypothetical protein
VPGVSASPREGRGHTALHALLAACGGFLLATLWFDLMFDVQVLGHPAASGALPEATIASIAAYYRRVTTDAHPMEHLIGVVMVVAVLGSVWSLRRPTDRRLGWVAVVASVAPIGLAATRVFPNAVRLAARDGSLDAQSALARSIFVDHVCCLVSIVLFTAIQIVLARAGSPPPADTR